MWILKNKVDEVVFVSDDRDDLRRIQLSNRLYENLLLTETNYLYFVNQNNILKNENPRIGLIDNAKDFKEECDKGSLITFTLKQLDRKMQYFGSIIDTIWILFK